MADFFKGVSVLFLCVSVTGCASKTTVTDGNEFTVTVNWSGGKRSQALGVADAHCAQYGKHARLRDAGAGTFWVHYDCIK